MSAILFFFICFLFGYLLVSKLKLVFSPLFALLVSLILGTTLVTLILFFASWVVPMTKLSLMIELGVTGFLAVWLLKSTWYLRSLSKLKQQIRGWSVREKLAWAFLVILVIWLFGRSIFYDTNGQLWAGDRLVWVDWPLHIAMATNFAFGHNVPPQNPTFAGIPLIYPFFADFVSGVLMALGSDLPRAFAVPGIVLTLGFFGIYVKFGSDVLRQSQSLRVLKSLRMNVIGALVLSLFWGGLGWVFWLKEAFANELTLVETLLMPPREYTFWGEKGLWFFTFLYSEILPQRAFLFGLPLFFLVLLLVYRGWQSRSKKHFLIAGVVGGIMPFFHTHAFISLGILSVSAMGVGLIGHLGSLGLLKKNWKEYVVFLMYFVVPFGILSALQLPMFLTSGREIPFQFGWMKENEHFVLFWFKNTGLFIPLYLLGLWKGKFDRFSKVLGIAAWSLFILPNLFRFAPWGYDNLKIFTFWYLIGSLFVMAGLVWVSRLGHQGKMSAVLLFVSLILSGVVEVGRILPTNHVKVGLWQKEDQELAAEIRENTSPSDVFLTAAVHDHPVSTLAGRKILLGFPGNSWSWGIKGWDTREQDVHTMFRGGEEAKSLWKKYGVDYIIVSEREKWFEPNLNDEYIRNNSQLVIEKEGTRIYKLL